MTENLTPQQKSYRTRVRNKFTNFTPSAPIQLPYDQPVAPPHRVRTNRESQVIHALLAIRTGLHSVTKVHEFVQGLTKERADKSQVSRWLKEAAQLGLLEVRIQPMPKQWRYIFFYDGQALPAEYRPYLAISEFNDRFYSANPGSDVRPNVWW